MFQLIIAKSWQVVTTPITVGEITFRYFDIVMLSIIGFIIGIFIHLEVGIAQGKYRSSRRDRPKKDGDK